MKNSVQVIMKNSWIVEIFKKKIIPDVFGNEIKKSIQEIGIKNISNVKVSNLYKISGEFEKQTLKKIVEELLIDNVSERYRIYKKSQKKKGCIVVEVWLKEGVADPVGETAKRTIIESGILKELKVNSGKKYYLKGKFKKQEIVEICERILANTLIQDYKIFLS